MAHSGTVVIADSGPCPHGSHTPSSYGLKHQGDAGIPHQLKPLTVTVHLLKHILQLLDSGELPQAAHHPAELLLGDRAITILIEQTEGLTEFCGMSGARGVKC